MKRIYRIGASYACAIIGPIVVGLFRYAIAPWAQDQAALVFFTLPVALAASLGGIRPGIIASVLGLLIGKYFFIAEKHSFTITDSGSAVSVLGFTFTWLFISLGGDVIISRRRAIRKSEALRFLSESRLSTLLRNISDGFYVIDSSRRITLVNQALLTQLEASDHELIGKRVDDVFDLDESILKVFDRALASGEPEVIERITHGQTFELRLLPDSASKSMAVFVHDVTLIKQLQQLQSQLLREERARRSAAEEESRKKDDFVATLSHELRTPMTSIVGWAEILRMRAKAEPEILEGVDAIESAARIQASLIDDLLDLSRIVTGQLRLQREVIDIGEAVGEVVANQRSLAQGKGCELRWTPPESELYVRVDPTRLSQVVGNLLGNALKFTEDGGWIEVSVREDADSAIIEVADSGKGIEPDFLPHIFDRFRQGHTGPTRRYGGLGLGLAIVRQLVQEHGGTVEAQSEGLGLGSRFTVRLPLTNGLPRATLNPDDETETFHGVRILLVEDDDPTRRMLQEFCTLSGATVKACASAREALDEIVAFEPDVVISDIGMPDMDGFQFVREMRKLPGYFSNVPAVALTAFAGADDQDRAFEAGFDMHLQKPIDLKQLVVCVQSLLGGDEGGKCHASTPPASDD